MQSEVVQLEEEGHKRLQEAEEKQRAADRCARDGGRARRELERLKKAIESSFEDLQRQVNHQTSTDLCVLGYVCSKCKTNFDYVLYSIIFVECALARGSAVILIV